MPVDIVMPQLGLTMTEGKLLRWYKRVGESFQSGEPLLEVETDKVNMDVEATEAGTLIEAVPPQEEPVPVTTVIGRYLRTGEAAPAAAAGAPAEPAERARAPVSPRARAAAQRLGMDLTALEGSGPHGRIVEADVLRAAEARPAAPAPAPVAAPAPPQPPAAAPLSKLRRITAERMAESFRSAPHFYVSREIDAAELLALKRTLATALEKRGLPELTLTDLLLKALALALRAHPDVNARWENGEVRPNPGVAVGLAAAVEDGLIAPVLRDVDRLDITELVRRRKDATDRARAGRLRPDDLGGAGATLSNLGMYGVDQFQAILNPPESVIVATGRVRDRVVAVNGAPAVRPTLFATVSADHRVLDGAAAARFLATFAEALENPGLLLLPGPEGKP